VKIFILNHWPLLAEVLLFKTIPQYKRIHVFHILKEIRWEALNYFLSSMEQT